MTAEIWLQIPGFDIYQASDRGRVRSIDRRVDGPWGTPSRIKRGKILSGTPDRDGYLWVTLYRSTQYRRAMHVLVLEAFSGKCPYGMQARHLDGYNQNNRPDNLKWGTKVEDAADKKRHGTVPRGETHGRAKLTESVIRRAQMQRGTGLTLKAVAALSGVSVATIHAALSGTTWAHLQAAA